MVPMINRGTIVIRKPHSTHMAPSGLNTVDANPLPAAMPYGCKEQTDAKFAHKH